MKRILTVLGFVFVLCGGAYAQAFQQFITRIYGVPELQRQAIADSFMNAVVSVPVIEYDTIVHYVYNAPAGSVVLAGDATGWNPNQFFTRVTGTNFWFFSTNYEADARLDYKLVINANNWILDPKNPNTCASGYGPNSELRMPGCVKPPETSYYSNIPHGTVRDTTFTSAILGTSRTVKIYLPDGYPTRRASYPVILFHDGLEYLSLCSAKNILDYLIANHLITPVIAVFVPPVQREEEYAGSKKDKFTDFITTELMPVIDEKYKTSLDPQQRAMTGASNGGNISLYIGMKHPELFGKIAAQSSNVISEISMEFSTGPKLNLSLYIDIGTYDIGVLIPMVHNFRDILQNRGYNYQFREWHEGHSWGNWKEHLRLPLMQFFPYTSGLNDPEKHQGPCLFPNRPNPFMGKTIIPFSAVAGSELELCLYDISGRKLETLFSGTTTTGENKVDYQHRYGAGEFILTLEKDNKISDSMKINGL